MPTPCSAARDHRPEIVDRDLRRARILGVAPEGQKRIEIVEKVGRGRRAESDQMMAVEVLDVARLRAPLEVVGRSVGVEMHGEQPPADDVGLHWLAQAQRHVGLPHAEIEVLVRQEQLQLHFRIEFDEFAEARREPVGAESEGAW